MLADNALLGLLDEPGFLLMHDTLLDILVNKTHFETLIEPILLHVVKDQQFKDIVSTEEHIKVKAIKDILTNEKFKDLMTDEGIDKFKDIVTDPDGSIHFRDIVTDGNQAKHIKAILISEQFKDLMIAEGVEKFKNIVTDEAGSTHFKAIVTDADQAEHIKAILTSEKFKELMTDKGVDKFKVMITDSSIGDHLKKILTSNLFQNAMKARGETVAEILVHAKFRALMNDATAATNFKNMITDSAGGQNLKGILADPTQGANLKRILTSISFKDMMLANGETVFETIGTREFKALMTGENATTAKDILIGGTFSAIIADNDAVAKLKDKTKKTAIIEAIKNVQ